MRIIAGNLRGKKLLTPNNSNTRPTSDRNREALFNIISSKYFSNNFQNVNVLDVFAGSGALGLEALSRGAFKAAFVENDHNAVNCIKKNIANCRFENNTYIYKQNACSFVSKTEDKYSLIFLDPPYDKGLISPALDNLAKQKILAKNAVIVVETSKSETINIASCYKVIEERFYGITKITFCCYE